MLTKKMMVKKIMRKAYLRLMHNNKIGYPLFIFGAQRSGTNMFVKVLEKSKETECYHEIDEEAFDNFVLREMKQIESLIKKSFARVIIFKCISDSQNAQKLLDHFPESKAIWIFRQFQDVVNSSLRNFREHRKYLHYVLYNQEIARWRSENVLSEHIELIRYFYEKGIDDASSRALIWYLRNYQLFQQELQDDNRILLVKYEDIVTNKYLEFNSIFNFLGIKFSDNFISNIFTSSVNKNSPQIIDPEVKKLCEKLQTELISCHKMKSN